MLCCCCVYFEVPGRESLEARRETVMEAIYAAFAVGWDLAGDTAVPGDDDLVEEARFLSTLRVQLGPGTPEVLGLAALIALASTRQAARLNAQRRDAPLLQQDTGHWDHALIAQGEAWLFAAHGLQQIGRFQLEAAIQSADLDRARSGRTDGPAVALLYEGLLRMAPSLGAAVGRALAVAHMQGPLQGLAALRAIDDAAQGFQPCWAARTDLPGRSARRGTERLEARDRAGAWRLRPQLAGRTRARPGQ